MLAFAWPWALLGSYMPRGKASTPELVSVPAPALLRKSVASGKAESITSALPATDPPRVSRESKHLLRKVCTRRASWGCPRKEKGCVRCMERLGNLGDRGGKEGAQVSSDRRKPPALCTVGSTSSQGTFGSRRLSICSTLICELYWYHIHLATGRLSSEADSFSLCTNGLR